jgi:hypothetical protein
MRGRNNNNSNNNNNNRRGPNPLTRSYESNGPDVKIRGSAQQIAEKYATLARDAQSSGDRVMAENYLQHAEHYNRIIAAAQAQVAIQQARDTRDETDEDGEDDQRGDGQHGEGHRGEGASNGGREHRQHYANDGSGPQPVIEGTPAELAYNNHHNGAGEQPQPSANGADSGNGRGERMNGGHAEAAPAEEEAAPRRPRRPRRRTNGRSEEDGRTNGAQPAEAAGATEQPSDGGDGAREQADQS